MTEPTERDREMARQFLHHGDGKLDLLAHVIATARAEERERCAKIAEAQVAHWTDERRARGNYKVLGAMNECKRVAQAIREGE